MDVLEGDKVDDTAQNTRLGAFELTREAEMVSSDNADQVEVHMGLDADGVIDAMVRDTQSGRTKTISVMRNS